MKGFKNFLRIIILSITLLSCNTPDPDDPLEFPLIYFTVAGHIEDTQVYADCASYSDFHAKLLDFAETFSETRASFNLQIDYEFFIGTQRCETQEMRQQTAGLNIIDYLAINYGFEIDAHQEGGMEQGLDNYADVRYIGGLLTSAISEIVGGMVWDDPAQFARLAIGEQGLLYPEFTWYPEILTLAVSHTHHKGDFSNDDTATGVWKPKGARDNFWVHSPEERMVYIGPGEHTDWGNTQWNRLTALEYMQHLIDNLESGKIPSDKIYTVTLTVPQSIIFNAEEHSKLLSKLSAIDHYVQSGHVQYALYSEVVDVWQSRYDSEPNIYIRN